MTIGILGSGKGLAFGTSRSHETALSLLLACILSTATKTARVEGLLMGEVCKKRPSTTMSETVACTSKPARQFAGHVP